MKKKDYKEMYEELVCSLKGLQFGCLLLKSQGNEVIGIDIISSGIEKAIEESEGDKINDRRI